MATSPDLVSSGRCWSFPPTSRTTTVSGFNREIGVLRSLGCASSRVQTRVSQSRSGHRRATGHNAGGSIRADGGAAPSFLDRSARRMLALGSSLRAPRFIIILAVGDFLEQFVSASYMCSCNPLANHSAIEGAVAKDAPVA